LRRKDEFRDNYIIIYGLSNIEVKTVIRTNRATKEEFEVKNIVFRYENKFRFSMSLYASRASRFETLFDKTTECDFAVFGKLELNNKFLNVVMLDPNHIIYYV